MTGKGASSFLSRGGDSTKHSESDNVDADNLLPLPKRNCGSWLSEPPTLNERLLVEYPLVRVREGRRKALFFRLWKRYQRMGSRTLAQ